MGDVDRFLLQHRLEDDVSPIDCELLAERIHGCLRNVADSHEIGLVVLPARPRMCAGDPSRSDDAYPIPGAGNSISHTARDR